MIESKKMMRNLRVIEVVILFTMFCGTGLRAADEASKPLPAGALLVADFKTAERVNKLGGEYSAWASSGADPAGVCEESIDPAGGPDGLGAWKITYDISNEGSYSGTGMKLMGLDATTYKTLSFRVKNEAADAIDFIVELKVDASSGLVTRRYTVRGVGAEWKTVQIPLADFRLPSLKPLAEMTTVFDKTTSVRKGAIRITEIAFLP